MTAQIIQFKPKHLFKISASSSNCLGALPHALVAIHNWQPVKDRYHITEIMRELKISGAAHVAAALRMHGWDKSTIRISVGNNRHVKTMWAPPGAPPIQKRGRGRPSNTELLNRAVQGSRLT